MTFIPPPDRVAETTTTTGTGTYTVAGAVTGFQTVSAGVGDGNRSLFVVEGQSGGDWEVFLGTYTHSGATVSRDRILASSNLGSAVNWGAGTKNLFCAVPSEFRQSILTLFAVDSATEISIGDMLWIDTDDVKPASDFSWDTDLETTQASFAGSATAGSQKFCGIAMEASANGETVPVLVDIAPRLHRGYAVASGNYEIGQPLGPDKHASNNEMLSNLLESCGSGSGCARAASRGTSVTTLDVVFAPGVFPSSKNSEVG